MKQYRIIKEGSVYVAQKRFLLIFWCRLHKDGNFGIYSTYNHLEGAQNLIKQRKKGVKRNKVIEYL